MTSRARKNLLISLMAVALAACQQHASTSPGVSGSTALATIDGTPITGKDLKSKHRMMLYQAEMDAYRAKQNMIEDLIMERLMNLEAQKAGISIEDLRKREVEDKVPMVTAAEIEETYKKQEDFIKKRFKEMGKPMPPKNEIKDALSKDMMRRRGQERFQNFAQELRAAHKVEVLVKEPESPRVEVAAGDNPSKGPTNAKVQIIEFSDFQCPYCARAVPVLKQIEETYGDKVRVVFRDFPLSFHNTARMQAEAGACANDQGKFWEYHDLLFSNQPAVGQAFASGKEADLKKQLSTFAKTAGLKIDEFSACLDAKKFSANIEADMKAAEEAGVASTPSFFVNGRPVAGALPFGEFKKLIDEELAKN